MFEVFLMWTLCQKDWYLGWFYDSLHSKLLYYENTIFTFRMKCFLSNLFNFLWCIIWSVSNALDTHNNLWILFFKTSKRQHGHFSTLSHILKIKALHLFLAAFRSNILTSVHAVLHYDTGFVVKWIKVG